MVAFHLFLFICSNDPSKPYGIIECGSTGVCELSSVEVWNSGSDPMELNKAYPICTFHTGKLQQMSSWSLAAKTSM